MREILFRGKRKDNGKWVEGWVTSQFKKFSEGEILTRIKSKIFGGGEHLVDTQTVGQYIGLTDKNGKKIFEGDVVKVKSWYVVVFEDGAFGLKAYNKIEPVPLMGHMNFERVMQRIEIIGNIHDNPELLTEVQK